MRFIDADHGREIIETSVGDFLLVKIMKTLLEKIPTADVAPVVHGHWILGVRPNVQMPMCDICHKQATSKYNFCPNCGAKMDRDIVKYEERNGDKQ